MEILFDIFLALLLISGIIILAYIILSLVTAPIVDRVKAKKNKERFEYLQKITDDFIEELKKQENEKNEPKKTTRKPRNTKKNEEN